jgi:hypothetical protein
MLRRHAGYEPFPADDGQHGDVLHAWVGDVRADDRVDSDTARECDPGDVIAGDFRRRAETHGQRLKHRVVIDECAAVLQGGQHGAQGLVTFEADDQVRLALGDHGAVGGFAEPDL